jgi:hypothetical protein
MTAFICGAGLCLILASHPRTLGYAVKNLGVFVLSIATALQELSGKERKSFSSLLSHDVILVEIGCEIGCRPK